MLLHLLLQRCVVHQLAFSIDDGAGKLLGLRPRVCGDVTRKIHRDARRLISKLSGRLREPALDRAIHQQVAEAEHRADRQQREQHRARKHARTEARSKHTAALLRIELQNVAQQQQQTREEQQKCDEGNGREQNDLARRGRI